MAGRAYKIAEAVRGSLIIYNGMNSYAKTPATCITQIQVNTGVILVLPCIVPCGPRMPLGVCAT
jgi:hypothetical protein